MERQAAIKLIDYLADELRKETGRQEAAFLRQDQNAIMADCFRAQGYRHALGAVVLAARGRVSYSHQECAQAVAEAYPELCYPEGKNEDPVETGVPGSKYEIRGSLMSSLLTLPRQAARCARE